MSKRSANEGCKVFSADGGHRVIQRSSRDFAEFMVSREIWEPAFDTVTGEQLGYRIAGGACAKLDEDLRSIQTTAAISPREMELNVERSRTRGLNEEKRMERLANHLEPEDAVERIQAKVRVWLKVGPERGSILQAWPR